MISIIGTHGSGKTTLIQKIESILLFDKSVPYLKVSEVARLCPYNIGQSSNEISQKWIFETQCYFENVAMQFKIPCIMDRCVIDQYAYYIYWVGENIDYENIIINQFSKYSKIIYLKRNPNFLKDDGVRPVDVNFQKKIDEIILYLISKLPNQKKIVISEATNSNLVCLIVELLKANMLNDDSLKIEMNEPFAKHTYEEHLYTTLMKLHTMEDISVKLNSISNSKLEKWLNKCSNVYIKKNL